MPGEGTKVHENREPDWAMWVRRAAADICALRRSAPTLATALSLFSKPKKAPKQATKPTKNGIIGSHIEHRGPS